MKAGTSANAQMTVVGIILGFGFFTGFLLGYLTKDFVFSSNGEAQRILDEMDVSHHPIGKPHGLSIHTLLTSSGDHYQNFQTRIAYASYQLAKQQPGGEMMVAFTRILHRTVPDYLMEEVPTFHVWDIKKPECDGWCDYPVANRPGAIMQFFQAAAKDPRMIKGAWVLMTECDYLWMRPARAPGDAYDPTVPSEQYFYDYIIPQHPDAAPSIMKLYGEGNGHDVKDVPASGPSPVIMRQEDWFRVGTTYTRISTEMEADTSITTKLGWVREMYAWDVACALHKGEVPMRTLNANESSLMVQPPFDISMFNASFCHYTWGVLYHTDLPSKGAKPFYKWEKREFNNRETTLKVPNIPMPPDFKEGWFLEFDAPLTLPRHNLNVEYLAQMNKAIDTLPDLTAHADQVEATLIPEFKASLKSRISEKVRANIRYVDWSKEATGKHITTGSDASHPATTARRLKSSQEERL